MSAFDDATNVINTVSSGPNQAVSDHGQIPQAVALFAIAEAINGLTAAIREGRA